MYVDIEKIKQDYMAGLKYKEIQEKYNISNSQLIYYKQKYNWKRKSNRSQLLKENQRAVGNRGGPGAEKGNKRAVTTGEYETILYDAMTESEKALFNSIQIKDEADCLIEEYKMLKIREFRISKRITELQEKQKDMSIERIVKRQYKDNISSEKKTTTETTTEATNIINHLQKLEDSLTKVQEAERKCLESIHKIGNDNRKLELDLIRLEREIAKDGNSESENMKDDSFIKALDDSVDSTWENYDEESE